MTRPLPRNGFGLTAADAEREVQAIEAGMTLLPDSEACLSRVAQDFGTARGSGCSSVRCEIGAAHGHASSKPYTDIEFYGL